MRRKSLFLRLEYEPEDIWRCVVRTRPVKCTPFHYQFRRKPPVKEIHLITPIADKAARPIRAGDNVLVSGTIYALRDTGHKRLVEILRKGKKPPFEMSGAVIYYVGPTPAPAEMVIGSAGPTTSNRMDAFMPDVLAAGLKATVGKGERNAETVELMKKHAAVYLAAIGGTGALLAGHITAAEIIAWEDLGTEALRRLTVKDFPTVCACDAAGNAVFEKFRRAAD